MNESARRPIIVDAGNGQDRSTDEIIRDIERRRESITRTVDQAGQKVEESLNWKEQVRAHPYGALAVAVGAAFATARLLQRGSSPVERLATRLSDNVDGVGSSLRHSIDAHGGRSRTPLARTVATTLAAIAARTMIQAVRRTVVEKVQPKYTEEEHHAR